MQADPVQFLIQRHIGQVGVEHGVGFGGKQSFQGGDSEIPDDGDLADGVRRIVAGGTPARQLIRCPEGADDLGQIRGQGDDPRQRPMGRRWQGGFASAEA